MNGDTFPIAVLGLSDGELVLVLTIILILFVSRKIPDLARGLGHGLDEFIKSTKDVADKDQRESGVVYEAITPDSRTAEFTFRARDENDFSIVLFIAEGFGVGRTPFAPDTFGSLVGVLWFIALLAMGNVLLLTAAYVNVAVLLYYGGDMLLRGL